MKTNRSLFTENQVMTFKLETERLLLRELSIADAEDFFLLNEDPEVMRYTGDRAFASIEEAHTFLQSYKEYKKNGFGRWAVLERTTGRFLGWCGLKLNEQKEIDLGFRFFKRDWGKGYATESSIAALDYGFTSLKLDRIIGRVASENKASIRVLEKVGMKYWKKDLCKGIEGALYYELNKSDFLEKRTVSGL